MRGVHPPRAYLPRERRHHRGPQRRPGPSRRHAPRGDPVHGSHPRGVLTAPRAEVSPAPTTPSTPTMPTKTRRWNVPRSDTRREAGRDSSLLAVSARLASTTGAAQPPPGLAEGARRSVARLGAAGDGDGGEEAAVATEPQIMHSENGVSEAVQNAARARGAAKKPHSKQFVEFAERFGKHASYSVRTPTFPCEESYRRRSSCSVTFDISRSTTRRDPRVV